MKLKIAATKRTTTNRGLIKSSISNSFTISLMESSSSSHIRRYHVYLSFHAPDLPKGFINNLHDHFASKGMSDVRTHMGDFGIAFERTCEGKTKEMKLRWSKALAHVACLYGEVSQRWDDDSAMVERIASHVFRRLNDKW